MSQSLPLKYRPQVFGDLVGQPIVATYLSKLIRQGEARNLILAGSHGSGKTSAGRIYARALNCTQITPTGDPCNSCDNCRMFMREQMLDYYESDLSSKGKVEDVRQMLELAKAPPQFGKYRVILGDEAHNATKNAWDAMLKLIEEPPPYLVWIFCTTEGAKIRPAIRSRCQSLTIHTIDKMTLTQHLLGITQKENIVLDPLAIELVASLAKGHARDALTMLEQIATMGAQTMEDVTRVLGLDHALKVVTIAQNLIMGKTEDALQLLLDWPETPLFKRGLLADYFVFLSLTATGHAAPAPHPALGVVENARHRAVSDQAELIGKTKQTPGPVLMQKLAGVIQAQPVVSDQATILACHIAMLEYFETVSVGADPKQAYLQQPQRERRFSALWAAQMEQGQQAPVQAAPQVYQPPPGFAMPTPPQPEPQPQPQYIQPVATVAPVVIDSALEESL